MSASSSESIERSTRIRIQLVAVLFAVLGAAAWIEAIHAAAAEQALQLGLGLLLLPASVGLWRRRERWRKISRAVALLAGLSALAVAVLALALPDTARVVVMGITLPMGSALPTLAVLAYVSGTVLLTAWIFRLLGRPAVVAHFSVPQGSP